MSKISSKQRKVIEFLRYQLHSWEFSNDIYSPSHYGYIEASLRSMDVSEVLTEEEKDDLEYEVSYILKFIQSLDREIER